MKDTKIISMIERRLERTNKYLKSYDLDELQTEWFKGRRDTLIGLMNEIVSPDNRYNGEE